MRRLAFALAAVAAAGGACKKPGAAEAAGERGAATAVVAPGETAAEVPAPPDAAAPVEEGAMTLKIREDVGTRLARYARMPLAAEVSSLGEEDRRVLAELRKAADLMGELAFRQTWEGNPGMRDRLAKYDGPNAQEARDLFRVMSGPWDRQDGYLPFVGDAAHPEGSAFYPEGLTKERFGEWVTAHPDQAVAFRGFFTVIGRDGDGLVAVPYSEEYRSLLGPAAQSLRAAAAITTNESLKRYLETRAAAFESNDYYESDVAWLHLEGPLEVVLGPYETYDDGLVGYKASFEAFLCVENAGETAKLAAYRAEIPFLESILPIPDEHKNPNRGDLVPIRVVDELYATGQAGVLTIAFNLPNDEHVRETEGFKNVLLLNVMRAKYDAILLPIAERVLPPQAAMGVSFEPFMNFVLFHELSHGLGPGKIKKDGRDTDVRTELRDKYPTIEEAKADILSLFVQKALVDKGAMPAEAIEHLPETFVAGIFRTARFGISEAHGQGVLVQVNYLLEKGAIAVTPEGRFVPVAEKFYDGVRDLATALLMLQALGDYEGTITFLEKYGREVPPGMPPLIESLGAGIPVDIDPVFPQF